MILVLCRMPVETLKVAHLTRADRQPATLSVAVLRHLRNYACDAADRWEADVCNIYRTFEGVPSTPACVWPRRPDIHITLCALWSGK